MTRYPRFEVDDLFDMRSTQCMSESSLALLILGRSNTGKSNAAKEIVRKLHNKRNYGHFFLITSKASYLSSYNRVQNWCRRDQVLLWDDDDSLSPTQRKDFFMNLGKRILQWSSSGERTLLMVDDLTEHSTRCVSVISSSAWDQCNRFSMRNASIQPIILSLILLCSLC